MEKIKEALIKKDPKISELIQPTIFKELNEIQPDEVITRSYLNLTQIETIASQYEWLSLFCSEERISEMEICNEKARYDVDNRTRKLLNKHLDKLNTDFGYYYQLNQSAKGKDIYNVYGNFRFPIFDYTKPDLHKISVENGFDDIMNLTWFCLMPTKFSNPCGKCHPCRAVYREGLLWRLSVVAKFRYFTWPVFRKIAAIVGLNKK